MNDLKTFVDLYGVSLAGGVAVALVCSVLSVFVVLKRMSFIGEGIAHAAFGGVGVALLAGLFVAGLRPVLARDAIVACFCLATALAIGATARRGKISEDTSIGIWLVCAMALGVVLLDVRSGIIKAMMASGQLTRGQIGYTPSFETLLFGDVLFVTPAEVIATWVLAIVVVAAVIALFKELVFFAFDEETAKVFGVRTTLLYYGLLVFLSLAVVAAMRSLGVILAAALLILPGAAARFWSQRIGYVTIISVLLGVGGLVAGFFLSIYLRYLSTGPVIVLTLGLVFAGSYLASVLRVRLRRRARLASRT